MIPSIRHVLRARSARRTCRLADADARPARTLYFVVSAVFHYLGPAFAVLLFARVDVLGVAWLRIASAALVFARLAAALARVRGARPRRPAAARRVGRRARRDERLLLPGDRPAAARHGRGDRVPAGDRAGRARRAHARATWRRSRSRSRGVYLLTDVQLAGEPLGVAFAFANAVLFAAYIVLAHRVARHGGDRAASTAWRRRCSIAAVVVTPIGGWEAVPGARATRSRSLAGVGVGHLLVGDPVRLATSWRWRGCRARPTR